MAADRQFSVHRGDEAGREIDAFVPDRAKARQRERDAVHAGPETGDPYRPSSSVTTARTFSMRTGLAASTVTPGNTAPDVSLTTPAKVPLPTSCAEAAPTWIATGSQLPQGA